MWHFIDIQLTFKCHLPYREAGVSSLRLSNPMPLQKRKLDTPASLYGRNLFVQFWDNSRVLPLALYWHSSGICHIGRQGYLVYAYSWDTPLTFNWHSSGLCHIGRQRYLVYAYSRDTPLAVNWHSIGSCHIGRQGYLVYAYANPMPLQERQLDTPASLYGKIWLFNFRLIGDEPMQCHCSCHIGRQGYLVYAYSRDTPLTVN